MTERRHYPPAHQIHAPTCGSLPNGLEILPTSQLAERYPNGVMHHCYHFHQNATGVAEQVFYPPHDYEASANFPADAVRPLCRSCRGTHEDETQVAVLAVVKPALVPAGAQSLVLPGRAAPGHIVLPGNARPGEASTDHRRNLRFRP